MIGVEGKAIMQVLMIYRVSSYTCRLMGFLIDADVFMAGDKILWSTIATALGKLWDCVSSS